jgi:hypothetical protein
MASARSFSETAGGAGVISHRRKYGEAAAWRRNEKHRKKISAAAVTKKIEKGIENGDKQSSGMARKIIGGGGIAARMAAGIENMAAAANIIEPAAKWRR